MQKKKSFETKLKLELKFMDENDYFFIYFKSIKDVLIEENITYPIKKRRNA